MKRRKKLCIEDSIKPKVLPNGEIKEEGLKLNSTYKDYFALSLFAEMLSSVAEENNVESDNDENVTEEQMEVE